MMLPLLLLVAQATDPLGDHAWARFARAPSLARSVETVEIATDGRDGDALRYQLRLTQRQLDRVVSVRWASSRDCPAVRQVLTAMEALATPRPDAPGIGTDGVEIIIDGTGYSLEAPSSYASGRVTMTSNNGSPLAHWVDDSLSVLGSCWRDEPPATR